MAVVRGAWVGAHAVWDPTTLIEAIVTRADPTVSGLAGLAGMVRPLNADAPAVSLRAVHVRLGPAGFGPGDDPGALPPGAGPAPGTVLAPLGPGHLTPVLVRTWRALEAGDAVHLGPYPEPVTLAFDGERETVVEPGMRIEVRLAPSPLRLLDATGLLRAMSARGALLQPAYH